MHHIFKAHLLERLQKQFFLHLLGILWRYRREVSFKRDRLNAVTNVLRQLSSKHIFEFNHRFKEKLALEVLVVAAIVDIYQARVVYFLAYHLWQEVRQQAHKSLYVLFRCEEHLFFRDGRLPKMPERLFLIFSH